MAKAYMEHGQKRRLGDLKPHPKNSRQHSDQQIDQIVAAMVEWDFTSPMIIDDKNIILAGHGRQLAGIKKFGADYEAPVVIAHGWSEQKKRTYIIADNRLAELATWNEPLLQSELKELSAGKSFELKPLGFTKLEAARILEPPAGQKSSRVPNAVVSYNLVFDNVQQQQTWYTFVRKLKAGYTDQVTLAAKFDAFLKEQLG